MPNASGNVLGTAIASAAGSTSASSAWSRRPAQATRSRQAARRPRGRRRASPRARRGTRPAGAARAPSSARVARRAAVEVAARRARARAPRARRGTRRSRRSAAARRGSRASTSGHAASSSSTPLEAISLPTNTTSRSLRARPRRARAAASRGVARERASRSRRPPVAPPRSRAAQRRPARARGRGRLARREARRRRRRAGRGGCARATVGSSIAAHRLSAVWREPTSMPRAPASPSRAYGRKRGYGLTVYSSALPWILTAYGTPSAERRARGSAGPITRWLASATSGRAALGHLAHGGDVGVDVALDLGVVELGERRAPRRPRSGRPRRPAAARRCPAGRRSRATGSRRVVDPSAPAVPVARRVDPVERRAASRSWQSRCTSCPAAHERLGQLGVVDVRAGAAQQVAVEDQDAQGGELARRGAVRGRC